MARIHRTGRLAVTAAIVVLLGAAPALCQDDSDDIGDLLGQVGADYASAYMAPFSNTVGANQNSGLYHTAHIPKVGLTWGLGVKVMGAKISDDDKTFRKVVEVDNLGDYFDDPALEGQAGTIVAEGPTVFGDPDTQGTVTAYVDGIPVAQTEGIEGLVDSSWSPWVAPEAWVGTQGVRFNIRWIPTISNDDFGDISYFGWGLQFNLNSVFPTLPVDVLVGYSRMDSDFDASTAEAKLETDAHSFYAAASRGFGMMTVYGGIAKESGDLSVSYVEESTGTRISFDEESDMKARFTLGATLDLPVKLNVEAAFGNLTVYSAGIMFGM